MSEFPLVVKMPGHKPAIVYGSTRTALDSLIHGTPVVCFRGRFPFGELVAWCDDDGISKGLAVNFARPTDGAEIRGPVVVTSMQMTKDGPDWAGLSTEQVAWALDVLGALGIE